MKELIKKNFELIVLILFVFGSMALTGYTLKNSSKAKAGMVKHLTGRV